MAMIIFSVPALLVLAMGVATFDPLVNMASMPDDELEEMREASLFPARRIRVPSCCESDRDFMNLGEHSHPRILVNNTCRRKLCPDGFNQCEELYYTINVTVFRDIEDLPGQNSRSKSIRCPKVWHHEEMKLSAACVPVQVWTQSKDKRIIERY
ncbi:prothoracicotropic hormone-like [Neodiprion fabricii]|uniref:prothoracicotropic hormone-like n=1 Tax=Neodiprion fabricii TaxID=2872261 RepID=UPI001ED90ED5|nr:prothoracicotropic hormone-like [Neodiprion fabricii]XP_046411731.1 prothoracicotropic hormone-like [Neodiprion fabricii]